MNLFKYGLSSETDDVNTTATVAMSSEAPTTVRISPGGLITNRISGIFWFDIEWIQLWLDLKSMRMDIAILRSIRLVFFFLEIGGGIFDSI